MCDSLYLKLKESMEGLELWDYPYDNSYLPEVEDYIRSLTKLEIQPIVDETKILDKVMSLNLDKRSLLTLDYDGVLSVSSRVRGLMKTYSEVCQVAVLTGRSYDEINSLRISDPGFLHSCELTCTPIIWNTETVSAKVTSSTYGRMSGAIHKAQVLSKAMMSYQKVYHIDDDPIVVAKMCQLQPQLIHRVILLKVNSESNSKG
ncbi:hypothetical protein [Campylobacter jejuni]|uniref:Uncharacterized protein n=1 Tax=Campylobacter jejuni TaxID=197 RepID=A0A431EAX6_CAMJU|nr:hypothetical protein [Campylobacter jejuni]RTJ78335.1 hypothetical protein C3H57_08495 [Campylobacter jejuni]